MARFHPVRIWIADFCVRRRALALAKSDSVVDTFDLVCNTKSGHLRLTPPGYWIAFVSIPLFQFLLLRWYLRLFIWSRFLWQASRLNLDLIPTHPDRAGGIAFLGRKLLCVRTHSFCSGRHARRYDCKPCVVRGRELAVLQNGSSRLDRRLHAGHPRPARPSLRRSSRAPNERDLPTMDCWLAAMSKEFEQKWVKGRGLLSDELLGQRGYSIAV